MFTYIPKLFYYTWDFGTQAHSVLALTMHIYTQAKSSANHLRKTRGTFHTVTKKYHWLLPLKLR